MEILDENLEEKMDVYKRMENFLSGLAFDSPYFDSAAYRHNEPDGIRYYQEEEKTLNFMVVSEALENENLIKNWPIKQKVQITNEGEEIQKEMGIRLELKYNDGNPVIDRLVIPVRDTEKFNNFIMTIDGIDKVWEENRAIEFFEKNLDNIDVIMKDKDTVTEVENLSMENLKKMIIAKRIEMEVKEVGQREYDEKHGIHYFSKEVPLEETFEKGIKNGRYTLEDLKNFSNREMPFERSKSMDLKMYSLNPFNQYPLRKEVSNVEKALEKEKKKELEEINNKIDVDLND